jgi:uncharacterized protein YutE (UPF0331/DUF86 family)
MGADHSAAEAFREAMSLVRCNTNEEVKSWLASMMVERFEDDSAELSVAILEMLADAEWLERPGAMVATALLAGANWERARAVTA